MWGKLGERSVRLGGKIRSDIKRKESKEKGEKDRSRYE